MDLSTPPLPTTKDDNGDGKGNDNGKHRLYGKFFDLSRGDAQLLAAVLSPKHNRCVTSVNLIGNERMGKRGVRALEEVLLGRGGAAWKLRAWWPSR